MMPDTLSLYCADDPLSNGIPLGIADIGKCKLDPILDASVAIYVRELDEDHQVDFKGKTKTFLRIYAFLATILLYTNAE